MKLRKKIKIKEKKLNKINGKINKLKELESEDKEVNELILKSQKELKSKVKNINDKNKKLLSDELKDFNSLKDEFMKIYEELHIVLKNEGIEEISIEEKEKFDFNKHDAVIAKKDSNYTNDEIIEELMKGYKLKDKIIKYSKVIVCKNN
jgi:molecular chaperone GrpE